MVTSAVVSASHKGSFSSSTFSLSSVRGLPYPVGLHMASLILQLRFGLKTAVDLTQVVTWVFTNLCICAASCSTENRSQFCSCPFREQSASGLLEQLKKVKLPCLCLGVLSRGSYSHTMCKIHYCCTGLETHRLTVKPQVMLSAFSLVSTRGPPGDSMGTLGKPYST